MTRHVWATIGRLVGSGQLPAPTTVAPEGDRITIKLLLARDVDEWVRHLGLHPASQATDHRYASIDWPPAPGWCGFTTVFVYCDTAAVVPA